MFVRVETRDRPRCYSFQTRQLCANRLVGRVTRPRFGSFLRISACLAKKRIFLLLCVSTLFANIPIPIAATIHKTPFGKAACHPSTSQPLCHDTSILQKRFQLKLDQSKRDNNKSSNTSIVSISKIHKGERNPRLPIE